MSLPVTAFAAYAVTLVLALGSAVIHPWFDAETHFVKALTSMNEATVSAVSSYEFE
jgi:hypothetical protein